MPDWLAPHAHVWQALQADLRNFREAPGGTYAPMLHRDRYRSYELVITELVAATGLPRENVRAALLTLVEQGVVLYKHAVGIRWGVKNPPEYG